MRTPGLDRLRELQRRGDTLFYGGRVAPESAFVHPVIYRSSADPRRVQGLWNSRGALLAMPPLIRQVFASGLAAACIVSNRRRGGAASIHLDELPGGVVALTIGQGRSNQGVLRSALQRSASLADVAPMDGLSVAVLPRAAFPLGPFGFPGPGQYFCPGTVPVMEHVSLCAGDLRFIARLLPAHPPFLDDASVAISGPLEGAFAEGGDLQFDMMSGETVAKRKTSPWLRRVSNALAEDRNQQWAELEPRLVSHPPERQDVGIGPQQSAVSRRALAFIEQRFTRAITLDAMAEAAGSSKRTLLRLFHAAQGCSPLAYVARRRIELAESLLKEKELTVAEVSERCGFAGQSALARSFKAHRGISPTAFRRRCLDAGARG